MIKPRYTKGQKVVINMPGDRKYHGLTAVTETIDPYDERLTYKVSVLNRDGKPMRVPLWLPERMLRPFKEPTLQTLEPGDEIVNRSGLKFVVLEPLSPVYFISPVGNPTVSMHVSAKDLFNDGFSLVQKESV